MNWKTWLFVGILALAGCGSTVAPIALSAPVGSPSPSPVDCGKVPPTTLLDQNGTGEMFTQTFDVKCGLLTVTFDWTACLDYGPGFGATLFHADGSPVGHHQYEFSKQQATGHSEGVWAVDAGVLKIQTYSQNNCAWHIRVRGA